jgi:hypothetical protein
MLALTDSGYKGAGHGVHVPVKKLAGVKELDNQYPDPGRASPLGAGGVGDRDFALLTQPWQIPAARHRRPREIGQIARAALVPA